MAVQIPFPLPATGYALNSKVRVNLDFLVDKFNEFNSGTATWDNVSIGTGNSLTGTLTFYNSSNAFYLTLQPGTTGSNTTFTLPTGVPSVSGALLQSTTGGVMSWSAVAWNVTGADNGLLYVPTGGTEVDSLANTLGSTGILIGSSAGTPKYVSLLGTTSQITVTINANDVTLSTPQNLDTSADFQVSSIRTGAGSLATCALRLNAANTGLYMSSSTLMDFVIGGTTRAELDNTGGWVTGGEHRGTVMRATSSLQVSTGASNLMTIQSGATSDWTLTLPVDGGTSGYVLRTNGSGTTSWVSVSAAGGATVALDNLAAVAINTTLVSDTNNTDDLGSSSIRWRTGYLATSLDISATSNQIVLGTTRTVTFTAPTPATASRTITFPDLSGDYSVIGTVGTQTIAGTLTVSGQLIGKGTATNDSAATAYIGEYVESVISTLTNFPGASGNLGDATSISLTAGDWDVSATVLLNEAGGSLTTQMDLGISQASGNDGTGLTLGSNRLRNGDGTTTISPTARSMSIPAYRQSLSGTTTIYAKLLGTYTVATPQYRCRLSARRVR